MSDTLEARIRKVEDYQEIANIQARYSFFVDEAKIDDLIDLFAEDFIWEVGFDRMTSFTSKPKLSAFLKQFNGAAVMMRHLPVTPCIEVDGDEATGMWYLFGMVTSSVDGKEVANWVQGTYKNAYRRVDGKWFISHLHFKYNFMTPFEDGWVKTPIAQFL